MQIYCYRKRTVPLANQRRVYLLHAVGQLATSLHRSHIKPANRDRSVRSIEIIDIESVLLSFLSKNFVSTKWRIYAKKSGDMIRDRVRILYLLFLW